MIFPSVSEYLMQQVKMKLDEDNAENNNQIEVDGENVDLSVDSVEESVGNVLFK